MTPWADIKRVTRKAVHTAFRREALYAAPGSEEDPVAVGVRWHAAGARLGGYGSEGYAEIVTETDRIVFDREELATLGITPERGAVVTITDEDPQISFSLDTRPDRDGPIAEVWLVTRA